VVIIQGEVWWADLGEPIGSGPGYRRPVVVVQCDELNQSQIGTVICVPLTSNLKWAGAPGNMVVTAKMAGLAKDSVANVSLITAIDKKQLFKPAGKLTQRPLDMLLAGIDVVLGR